MLLMFTVREDAAIKAYENERYPHELAMTFCEFLLARKWVS